MIHFSSSFCFSSFWAIFAARKTDPSGKVNFIEQPARGLCRGLPLAKFSFCTACLWTNFKTSWKTSTSAGILFILLFGESRFRKAVGVTKSGCWTWRSNHLSSDSENCTFLGSIFCSKFAAIRSKRTINVTLSSYFCAKKVVGLVEGGRHMT